MVFLHKFFRMLGFPNAKINLGLNIIGRRPDGFHDIETVYYPVGLSDALEVVRNKESNGHDELTITGYELPCNSQENIVLRAAAILREKFSLPALSIHLHKSIPPGSGLGGGSSDAACMLRILNRIFSLSLSSGDLGILAAQLGSDCPFFLVCEPSFATGRGEILSPAGSILAGFYIVMINPGISVSTREAYENCRPGRPERSLSELIKKPVTEWKESIFNDFERTVFPRHPYLRDIKNMFYDTGALYSSMSGSGSTIYGIYSEKPDLKAEVRKLVIFEGWL